MITLYHCVDSRSFRALWTLEELETPYRLVTMPFPPRARSAGYLGVNPLGTVPTLIDGDTRMTESSAICQYLVAKLEGGLNVNADDPEYGDFLNWLHFGEATLTFPQTLVFRYLALEPEARRVPQIVDDYTRWFFSRLRAVEVRTATNTYLCADRFTAADISVGYALLLASRIGLHRGFKPATEVYWQRLQQRAGYRRAQAAQAASGEQGPFAQPMVSD